MAVDVKFDGGREMKLERLKIPKDTKVVIEMITFLKGDGLSGKG